MGGPLDFAFFAPGLISAIFSAGEFALADEQNPFASVSLSIVFQAIPAVAEPPVGGGLFLLATVALVLAWRRREAA
jgi:MYXO-CTERM domain-containing protein